MSEHWQAQAACAGEDPGPWDHDTITGATEYAVAYATRICAECPVRVECLTDANAHHDEHGIRGGLLPSQRRVNLVAFDPKAGGNTTSSGAFEDGTGITPALAGSRAHAIASTTEEAAP